MPKRTGHNVRVNQNESDGVDRCQMCGVVITGSNTKGHHRSARRSGHMRCGSCYLKWKKETRKNGISHKAWSPERLWEL